MSYLDNCTNCNQPCDPCQSPCDECNDCNPCPDTPTYTNNNGTISNTNLTTYSGPNDTCIDVQTGNTLTTVFQKLFDYVKGKLTQIKSTTLNINNVNGCNKYADVNIYFKNSDYVTMQKVTEGGVIYYIPVLNVSAICSVCAGEAPSCTCNIPTNFQALFDGRDTPSDDMFRIVASWLSSTGTSPITYTYSYRESGSIPWITVSTGTSDLSNSSLILQGDNSYDFVIKANCSTCI